MRSWNLYAPEVLHLDKEALRAFVANQIIIDDYSLKTANLRFLTYSQKGFVGTCTYHVKVKDDKYAPQVTAVADLHVIQV